MKAVWVLAAFVVAGCDPQQMADKVVARTAQSVIAPVVGDRAALCIVEGANPAELRAIAVDYGVEAGTTTVANITRIATRPAVASCIAQANMAG